MACFSLAFFKKFSPSFHVSTIHMHRCCWSVSDHHTFISFQLFSILLFLEFTSHCRCLEEPYGSFLLCRLSRAVSSESNSGLNFIGNKTIQNISSTLPVPGKIILKWLNDSTLSNFTVDYKIYVSLSTFISCSLQLVKKNMLEKLSDFLIPRTFKFCFQKTHKVYHSLICAPRALVSKAS